MNVFQEIRDQDFFPSTPSIDSTNFDRRVSVRAVVLDQLGFIALLRLNSFHSHKLPGGGIVKGENTLQTLEREMEEEIGCTVRVLQEIGSIIEYRDQSHLIQVSSCFLTRQYGHKETSSFTEQEKSQKCEVVWVHDIEKAIQLVQSDVSPNYAGLFIQRRDLAILGAAKEIINKHL